MRANLNCRLTRQLQDILHLLEILEYLPHKARNLAGYINRGEERFQMGIDASTIVDVHNLNGAGFDSLPSQHPLLYRQVMEVIGLDLGGRFHLDQSP